MFTPACVAGRYLPRALIVDIISQALIQSWALDRTREARYTFQQAGPGVSNYAAVMQALMQLENQVQNLSFNFLNQL